MKVCLLPQASTLTSTIGGVNRVIADLTALLPKFGVDIVDDPNSADIRHCHALAWHPQVDVYTNHGVWETPREPYEKSANEIIYRLLTAATIVTSVAEHTTRIYKDKLNIKPRVIHNGVDLQKLRSIPSRNGGYFLWAKNNVSPVNDPRPALWLAQQMPHIQFVFTLVPSNVFVPPNVRVIGLQPYEQMLQIIANCAVLIATTREQFSVQVIEALALGKPVLGFNWGGTSEVIDTTNGALATPSSVQGKTAAESNFLAREWPLLLEAAHKILDNYQYLSEGASQSAEAYDWQKIIPQYIECYDDASKAYRGDIKVSIVITCYNLEEYIEDAVNSALAQRFQFPYEIIIVDDLSTDNSRNILRRLRKQHPQLKLIFNETNLKAGLSRNEGIKVARGEYIVCLDGDDVIEPTFLAKLYAAISQDRSIGIAYSGFKLFGTQQGTLAASKWDFDRLKQGNFIPCCNMFRKVAWERCGGYKNINPSWEDYELWLNMGKHGYYGVPVHEPLFHYRVKTTGRNIESQSHVDRLRAIVNACHPDIYPAPVGIVIPCYKQKKYLPEAINSLLEQTFQDFRVVIVDDGGHQHLQDVIPEGDYRFRLLELKSNSGLAAARNRGIELLNTEYIVPLDADDKLPKRTLERFLDAQNSTLDTIVVYGDIVAFWDDGTQEKVSLEDYSWERLLQRSIIPAMSMYSREMWEQIGGYDENMRDGYEDWDFYIRAFSQTGAYAIRLPHTVLYYRQRKDTMRATLEQDKKKLQSVLDYLRKKHYNIYAGVLTVRGPHQARQFMGGKRPLRYTGRQFATVPFFVNGNRYSCSANSPIIWVEERDVQALLQTGQFTEENTEI